MTTPNPYLVHTPAPAGTSVAKAPKSQVTLDRRAARKHKREAQARELGTLSMWELALVREARAARKAVSGIKLVLRVDGE